MERLRRRIFGGSKLRRDFGGRVGPRTLAVLAIGVLWLAFCVLVVRDFAGPLLGDGDTDLWEGMGYAFARHLRFVPWPQLDLSGDDTFFPYGTVRVFQAWGFERDLFYALGYGLAGIGPWLKVYYAGSVLATAAGVSALLVRDFGLWRAAGTGAIAAFGNAYAIVNKYPHHLNIAIAHWTAMGLTADFLLAKRAVLRQPVGLPLVLGRLALLGLSLGQDLGYIAGFSLASFSLTAAFLLALSGYRRLRFFWVHQRGRSRSSSPKPPPMAALLAGWGRELRSPSPLIWGILAAGAIAGFFYLPLTLQIFRAVKTFDFSEVYGRDWFFHPARLAIPLLPGFNPLQGSGWVDRAFPSPIEEPFDGVAGWFLLAIAAIGFWQARRWRLAYLPLLGLLLLAIAYRPLDFPTLQLFPWFSFNRVGGRCTVLFSTAFALLGLGLRLDGWRPGVRRTLAAGLVALAVLETATGARLAWAEPRSRLPAGFETYMATVRETPGAAVLDWPFCATGGNGVGAAAGLCPFFGRNPSLHALQRFHGKKVVGGYYGRLHPQAIAPYVEAGWPLLLRPDTPEILAARQIRCLRPDEWEFFEDFVALNDFAGINLYVDRLEPGCAAAFYDRFGPPLAETEVWGMGRVAFLPKPDPWRDRLDPERGRRLRFDPPVDLTEADLLAQQTVRGVRTAGLDRARERNGERWRWGLGPETVLDVRLEPEAAPGDSAADAVGELVEGPPGSSAGDFAKAATGNSAIAGAARGEPAIAAPGAPAAVLVATLSNDWPDQTVEITLDGRPAIAPISLAPGETVSREIPLPPGQHRITLRYARAGRQNRQHPASGDRPVAVTFRELALRSASAARSAPPQP